MTNDAHGQGYSTNPQMGSWLTGHICHESLDDLAFDALWSGSRSVHNDQGADSSRAPIGLANTYLYAIGESPAAFPHYPFYDILTGCNSNDITNAFNVAFDCAHSGHDLVTGWGSFNALQLAWAINYDLAGDAGAPSITFPAGYSPPPTNRWYNTNQQLVLNVTDTTANGNPAVGVAGFTADWDTYISDSAAEPTPGSGDGFYSGPLSHSTADIANANAATYFGYLELDTSGQGCHTAQVRAWDNTGLSSYQTYGPLCYDTSAPISTVALSGTLKGKIYISPVMITVSATDAGSGVKSSHTSLDGAKYEKYSAAIDVTAAGQHTLKYFSIDVAGNKEKPRVVHFTIR